MLLSVRLTLFTSTANDGTVWTFPILVEQIIKNNMTTIFPVCITMIAGYIIAREQKDDTLKNILTVPVTFKQLIVGKLLVCGLISLFLGLVCTAFTIVSGLLMGFPGFSAGMAAQGLVQITLLNILLCCLSMATMLAISTVIILSMRNNVEPKKFVKNRVKLKAPHKKGW